MKKPHSPKDEAARRVVRERFRSLNAALNDLAPSAFGVRPHEELLSDRLLEAQYQNRLMSAFLLGSPHETDNIVR